MEQGAGENRLGGKTKDDALFVGRENEGFESWGLRGCGRQGNALSGESGELEGELRECMGRGKYIESYGGDCVGGSLYSRMILRVVRGLMVLRGPGTTVVLLAKLLH